MIIKICGITNLDDALYSIEYGATALGFNFYPESPRYIEPDRAEEIVGQLPENVLKVAVVVMGQLSPVTSRLSALQLHGLTSESQIPETDKQVFIATSASSAHRFPHSELIIDTSWGSGRKADWEELKTLDRTFILSGGLTADNVAEAIDQLHPSGVDVCSGVELSPGKKAPDKLRRFIQNVRSSFPDSFGIRSTKFESRKSKIETPR